MLSLNKLWMQIKESTVLIHLQSVGEIRTAVGMEITQFKDITSSDLRSLLSKAAEMRNKAYIPYSKFSVGAALVPTHSKDVVITGCNVENVSFGVTICAERTAFVKGVSEGYKAYCTIAIAAVSNSDDFLVTPCGACRQTMAEFAGPDLQIYLYNPDNGKVGITSLEYLLPQAVSPNNMDKALSIGGR